MGYKKSYAFAIGVGMLLYFTVSPAQGYSGNRSILRGVSFEGGSAVLRQTSIAALEALFAELKAKPSLKLAIEGYTDSTGSPPDNLELSRRRAQAVANWLTRRGIAASRLKAVGYGGSRPIADNRTVQGRERNRRIEIVKIRSESPVAVLPVHSFEFEAVPDGVEVRHDFVIQNKGKAPLIISKVNTG